MAVEPRRGCGYRKIGGLYLMGGGLAAPCDRMPYALERCPCCGGGIKFTRGPQWLQPDFFSPHHLVRIGESESRCIDESPCPVCRTREDFGPHLLLWIGRAHYTPGEYLDEGQRLGVSRRISAIPKGLELGKTWVLLAHLDAIPPQDTYCVHCGQPRDQVDVPGLTGGDRKAGAAHAGCDDYEGPEAKPGIFCAFIPQRIELILKESDATPERRAKEEKRGVTIVTVPDDDKDHQGSVWDKADEESQPELPGVAS